MPMMGLRFRQIAEGDDDTMSLDFRHADNTLY